MKSAITRRVFTGGMVASALAAAPSRQPNLTVVLAEGDPGRIRPEGLFFELCYATPEPVSSLVELLAGRYSFRTGSGAPAAPTAASLLRSAGYRTVFAGRWPFRDSDFGRAGFDERLEQWAPPGGKQPVFTLCATGPEEALPTPDPDSLLFLTAPAGTGGKLNEEGVRVPLVVRGPQVPASGSSREPVDFTDFLPTLCELGGVPRVPPEAQAEGVSFASALRGSSGQPRRREWICSGIGRDRMVRTRDGWLLDGDGNLYQCSGARHCEEATMDTMPETIRVRRRLQDILSKLR